MLIQPKIIGEPRLEVLVFVVASSLIPLHNLCQDLGPKKV